MSSSKYYLAAMLVFKDESRYLKEWLDYHILLGVQHFYIYDNNSTDNPGDVLRWYKEKGIVTYNILDKVFTRNSSCAPHRMDCIAAYGSGCDWMAFIDIDEFMRTKSKDASIHDILDRYEEYSALGIRRIDFGTNYLDDYSEQEAVIERFTRRRAVATSVKSVVRPNDVSEVVNGHTFNVKDGLAHPHTINLRRRSIAGRDIKWVRERDITRDSLIINHYASKSREEFFYFKDKYPAAEEERKKFSYKIFDDKFNKKCNAVEDTGITFFVKFIKNNFVQKNYEIIKKYYESSWRGSLKQFLLEVIGDNDDEIE